jgi:TM2 domain-containing membrane protein YozV
MNRFNSKTISYILWALWPTMGLAGMHRFYNKRYASGILWLFTFGLFGVGQIIDLFIISDMVDEHNAKVRARLGMSSYGVPLPNTVTAEAVVSNHPPKPPTVDQRMIEFTKAAQRRNGHLSVTQAVLDTGCTFDEAEKVLKRMLKAGYVDVKNEPNTGVVVYEFTEL